MFSHLEPAYLQSLWIYTWSLLSIDKTNPAAAEDPVLLLPFGALWPRDSSLCCWVKPPWYASPLLHWEVPCPVLWMGELCHWLWKVSWWDTLLAHTALLKHDPLKIVCYSVSWPCLFLDQTAYPWTSCSRGQSDCSQLQGWLKWM